MVPEYRARTFKPVNGLHVNVHQYPVGMNRTIQRCGFSAVGSFKEPVVIGNSRQYETGDRLAKGLTVVRDEEFHEGLSGEVTVANVLGTG